MHDLTMYHLLFMCTSFVMKDIHDLLLHVYLNYKNIDVTNIQSSVFVIYFWKAPWNEMSVMFVHRLPKGTTDIICKDYV